MTEFILRPDPNEELWTSERCFILELSNSEQDEAVSIARTRVEPGETTELHRLNGVAERYVILGGQGMMEVGDLPRTAVGPGDVVRIPAGISQRIENNGDRDLVFLCVCTPRFLPSCYESLEVDSNNQSLGTRKVRYSSSSGDPGSGVQS